MKQTIQFSTLTQGSKHHAKNRRQLQAKRSKIQGLQVVGYTKHNQHNASERMRSIAEAVAFLAIVWLTYYLLALIAWHFIKL